jgi:hypothetical protein
MGWLELSPLLWGLLGLAVAPGCRPLGRLRTP